MRAEDVTAWGGKIVRVEGGVWRVDWPQATDHRPLATAYVDGGVKYVCRQGLKALTRFLRTSHRAAGR